MQYVPELQLHGDAHNAGPTCRGVTLTNGQQLPGRNPISTELSNQSDMHLLVGLESFGMFVPVIEINHADLYFRSPLWSLPIEREEA